MHDAIGYDLSAVVMPADLPGTSVGHSDELAGRIHELRQLDNSVFTLYTSIHRPDVRIAADFLIRSPCNVSGIVRPRLSGDKARMAPPGAGGGNGPRLLRVFRDTEKIMPDIGIYDSEMSYRRGYQHGGRNIPRRRTLS